jgi:hypothetical protein
MTHRTHPSFWEHYRQLPKDIQEVANKNFRLLKSDSRHSSVMAVCCGSGLAITANMTV